MMSGDDGLIKILKDSGDDEADLDLKILCEELTGEALEKAVMRRASGEPLAYILGFRHFYKECYKVCPGVLIPRGDTEIVVESALKYLGINKMAMGDVINVPSIDVAPTDVRFADLCTGSGCIGISLANELIRANINVRGFLADISDTAIATATDNAGSQCLDPGCLNVIKCDVLNSVPDIGTLDLIMSNPPYITNDEMNALDSVVKDFEPDLALRAGDDGMDFYVPLVSAANILLRPGGALIVEHGCDQGDLVREVFEQGGLRNCMTIRDYGSNPRATFGIK